MAANNDWYLNKNYMRKKLGDEDYKLYLQNLAALRRNDPRENVQRLHFPQAVPIALQPLRGRGQMYSERAR